MTRSRRLALVVALCACVAAPASAQEPVRVGVLTIRSGPIASCDRQMEDGLHTYRDVSQFWTYDPAAFLAAPVYSRDYPPAKHIE
ncbi:MAG: hypothetical protein DMD96_12175 [Candidatus Rokuibacteriota bacterium]|nr:MAG: hypothetical protein DMD96_12175 [Candidatus Rokubacteria bacterium]